MTRTAKNQRPKWAKNLRAKIWKHLCAMSYNSRPTLRELKENLAYQTEHNISCYECREAGRAAGVIS